MADLRFGMGLLVVLMAIGSAHAQRARTEAQGLGASAMARSTVIVHDSGDGVPIGPLLSQAMTSADIDEVSPLVQFPVRSPGLKPGLLGEPAATWPDARWLVQPVFLIGEDPQSIAWLQGNLDRLAAISASGMLVQVDTPEAYKRIQRLADGLHMAPLSSAWLEARLQKIGAAVLPLLILPDGRITQLVPELPRAERGVSLRRDSLEPLP